MRHRVRCGHCFRRMEGTPRAERIYYRCAARSMVPGAAALNGHPKNVYLPEAAVLGPLNAWIGELFDRKNVDRTVATLVASQG
ncbi:MAG: recombinase family protein, partial [Actinobacteria bacterium]|nr:recombinase family protein [Actinomycetota bacterium]